MKAKEPEVIIENAKQLALRPFVAISESDNDKATTESDLNILNNHLELCNAALPSVHSIVGLCMLSATVTKLIETRRKVKKLALGASSGNSKVYEVLE